MAAKIFCNFIVVIPVSGFVVIERLVRGAAPAPHLCLKRRLATIGNGIAGKRISSKPQKLQGIWVTVKGPGGTASRRSE